MILDWMTAALTAFAAVEHEIMMFALVGLLIGGLDDFLMDMLFIGRAVWRGLTVYTRYPRMTAATLPPPERPGPLALFIPAWQESGVIGAMLRHCLRSWRAEDIMLFVGTYPNDPDTIRAVAAVAREDARIRLVVLPHDGGTTKADCLNHLWPALLREEERTGRRFKGVILHDAEDVVHPDEIRLFDRMIERFDMVQLPVRPLLSPRSRWIAGHYADEFAEAHGRTLVLREAIGAAVPSAGVGCCFDRDRLERIARDRGGMPFDPASLTEDYEIGLHIREQGGRTVFVTMLDAKGGLICTQEHFPETMDDAVKQKARWFVGIALAGWDRLGWHGSLRERWMRLHDRRAALAALVILAAYLAIPAHAAVLLLRHIGLLPPPVPSPLVALGFQVTLALMGWRLASRAFWSARAYGWPQGLLAIPRTLVANYIMMRAMLHAMRRYVGQLKGGGILWEKTRHIFPTLHPPEAHAASL
ncbi:hypothetical protein GCM10007897_44400 [Sphingobium jiangsuense]|nr:hypothetical protein GCM10007897_44400 [Sphingobium jiangsuense]